MNWVNKAREKMLEIEFEAKITKSSRKRSESRVEQSSNCRKNEEGKEDSKLCKSKEPDEKGN